MVTLTSEVTTEQPGLKQLFQFYSDYNIIASVIVGENTTSLVESYFTINVGIHDRHQGEVHPAFSAHLAWMLSVHECVEETVCSGALVEWESLVLKSGSFFLLKGGSP